MSRFAEGTHAGARVTQKQVIGYVGSTGYSTGPHLHFGMYRGGHHVDPSRQDFPTAEPMDKKYGDEFKLFMAPLSAQLAALSRA
jgi:murein DD-endopeptidase MepM/ murein hydrolase activator NlpD